MSTGERGYGDQASRPAKKSGPTTWTATSCRVNGTNIFVQTNHAVIAMQLKISIYIGNTLRATRILTTPCTIGRSKTQALTITHPAVSREHCELVEIDGILRLRDKGSLNGTLYNGNVIDGEALLAENDHFNIGEIRLQVDAIPAPTAIPTPPPSPPMLDEAPESSADSMPTFSLAPTSLPPQTSHPPARSTDFDSDEFRLLD